MRGFWSRTNVKKIHICSLEKGWGGGMSRGATTVLSITHLIITHNLETQGSCEWCLQSRARVGSLFGSPARYQLRQATTSVWLVPLFEWDALCRCQPPSRHEVSAPKEHEAARSTPQCAHPTQTNITNIQSMRVLDSEFYWVTRTHATDRITQELLDTTLKWSMMNRNICKSCNQTNFENLREPRDRRGQFSDYLWQTSLTKHLRLNYLVSPAWSHLSG